MVSKLLQIIWFFCRNILIEYSEQVKKLGLTLFGLLSEALGLNPNHLNEIGCLEGLAVLYHYYPACPEPELTIGASKHSDSDFLTVLLQDHIGGLQILHENLWVDVPPVPGALVINIGDLLQASALFLLLNNPPSHLVPVLTAQFLLETQS